MTEPVRKPADASAYPKYPTIIHALAKAAELRPDAPGLVCEERELTYGQYAQAVAAMAQQFADVGVRDERIAFVVSNGLDACVGLARRHGGARADRAAQSELHRSRT